MPPVARSIERIRDVLVNADALTVRAACSACAYVADLDWPALAIGYGEETTLKALARHMKCQRCGAKGCGWQMTPRTSEYMAPTERPD